MQRFQAVRAALRAVLQRLLRAAVVLFVIGLAMLPVPIASALTVILKPRKQNVPAEILTRKRG